MENKHNQNLIVLTEDFTKNGILYPIGTNAEIIGIWSGKKEDKMEMAIRINDVIIEEIEQIRYRKLYPESYKDIVGWFDFQDIYDLAVNNGKDGDRFLEVGCFMGKSTAYLMQKIKESGKDINVSVVDMFTPECSHHNDLIKANKDKGENLYKIFKENMRSLGLIPHRTLKGKSQEGYVINSFIDDEFSMIFIDAAHDYESVKADLNNFYPKLKSGGIFAGHDYGEKSCGVGRAVDEFVKENNLKLDVITASWILTKP